MLMKSKFVFFDKHGIITYQLRERIKKFSFLKYSLFFLKTPSFEDILLGNFTLSNSIILVADV